MDMYKFVRLFRRALPKGIGKIFFCHQKTYVYGNRK